MYYYQIWLHTRINNALLLAKLAPWPIKSMIYNLSEQPVQTLKLKYFFFVGGGGDVAITLLAMAFDISNQQLCISSLSLLHSSICITIF